MNKKIKERVKKYIDAEKFSAILDIINNEYKRDIDYFISDLKKSSLVINKKGDENAIKKIKNLFTFFKEHFNSELINELEKSTSLINNTFIF